MNENIEAKVDAMTNDKAEAPKKKNNMGIYIAIAIVCVGVLWIFSEDLGGLIPEETETLIPADVQLYVFNDRVSNDSVNVEFWLMNVGEETATDIEVFIRVRSDNGTVLYSEITPTTALLLRENESCSGIYIVELDDAEYLTHTIEVSWSGGRHSYSKTTTL